MCWLNYLNASVPPFLSPKERRTTENRLLSHDSLLLKYSKQKTLSKQCCMAIWLTDFSLTVEEEKG